MYTVTFTGFHTPEQARAFANWYSGSGEQEAPIWMEDHADVTSCNAEKIELAHGGVVVTLNVLERSK